MRLVFLGPPGAGKGTQAKVVAGARGWAHISTGDMLRAAVKGGTDLGKQAQSFMEKGELIPDELMCAVVADRLKDDDCSRGWILDGFPRTRVQADRLNETLDAMGAALDKVVYFHIDQEVLVARLTGRLTCRGCGANFHVQALPPRVDGVCDHCGGELYVRADDEEETVRHRLEVYDQSTAELISFYQESGQLLRVEAEGTVEDVGARLAAELGDS